MYSVPSCAPPSATQLGCARGYFHALRFDAVGAVAHDARAAPLRVPQAAVAIDRRAVGLAGRVGEARRTAVVGDAAVRR